MVGPHAWDAARRAYEDQQYGQLAPAATDSPHHKVNKTESKPQTATTRHGGRSLDAYRRAYLEQLHCESAIEYPSSYTGGAARGDTAVCTEADYKREGEYDESESDDESDDDDEEISHSQGGVRCYDYKAYKLEKKHAGSNHDIRRHYSDYGEYRSGARAWWQDEYLGYGVRNKKEAPGDSVLHDTVAPYEAIPS